MATKNKPTPDYWTQIAPLEKALVAKSEQISELMRERDEARRQLAELQKKIADGKVWNVENPRLTPRAQAALNLAQKEATDEGATYCGTEHLLLAMLKQEEGIAKRHFYASGMTYEKVKYAIKVGRVS